MKRSLKIGLTLLTLLALAGGIITLVVVLTKPRKPKSRTVNTAGKEKSGDLELEKRRGYVIPMNGSWDYLYLNREMEREMESEEIVRWAMRSPRKTP